LAYSPPETENETNSPIARNIQPTALRGRLEETTAPTVAKPTNAASSTARASQVRCWVAAEWPTSAWIAIATA
jgi:hypothetical protein